MISLTLGLRLLFPWILGIFSAFLAKLGYQFGSILEYFYLKNKFFFFFGDFKYAYNMQNEDWGSEFHE